MSQDMPLCETKKADGQRGRSKKAASELREEKRLRTMAQYETDLILKALDSIRPREQNAARVAADGKPVRLPAENFEDLIGLLERREEFAGMAVGFRSELTACLEHRRKLLKTSLHFDEYAAFDGSDKVVIHRYWIEKFTYFLQRLDNLDKPSKPVQHGFGTKDLEERPFSLFGDGVPP